MTVLFHTCYASTFISYRASTTLAINEWHSVKISRLDKEGTLQINNEPVLQGFSGPPLNELNLELPLYIGGVE